MTRGGASFSLQRRLQPASCSKPAKNWGQPTLSQGVVSVRKCAPPFVAAWTERAVPNFSPRPQSPRILAPAPLTSLYEIVGADSTRLQTEPRLSGAVNPGDGEPS